MAEGSFRIVLILEYLDN